MTALFDAGSALAEINRRQPCAPSRGSDSVARLVLGDDHVVFLDALSTVLGQHGYAVSAVARSAAEMIALVRRDRPDACLIDRNTPLGDDAHTISQVLAASEGTNVVVLGASAGPEAVSRALDAGASGYLHQSRGVGALVSALERVLCGEVVVDVPQASAPRRTAEPNQALRLAGHLTGRERECLMMLVEGLDTAAMVQRLGVSRTTVRTHLQAVLTKLGVHSRLEAASFAVRHRLPDLWSSSGQNPRAGLTASRSAVGTSAASRPAASGLPAARTTASTVRPIRPRRPASLDPELAGQSLAAAAGRGLSAG
jgi:two-component system, NarL family, nitrate/nitrite response regulator NarL